MKNNIPIIYEIVYEKLIKMGENTDKIDKAIPIGEIGFLLAVVFHIPKEFHYGVLRELEKMDLIEINRRTIKVKIAVKK